MSAPAPPAPAQRRPPPAAPPPPGGGSSAQPQIAVPVIQRGSGKFLPPRIIVNGVEGYGKTSIAAHAPNPIILMSKGETGYETLLGSGLVPDCDRAEYTAWPHLLAQIDAMIATDTEHKTIVLDALGGFERLCHEFVCNRDFGGNWGDRGFGSFQKGFEISVTEWIGLLAKLDALRAKRELLVLILSHVTQKPFKNPLGPDFDRYCADCHHKTWSVTHKWADAVFFGTFETIVQEQKGRNKGIGGKTRALYTERCDGYDAKNRYGMEPEIEMPDDPAATWSTIWEAITKTRNAMKGNK